MTADETIKYFNKLRSQTTKKSELKVYDDFIQTLTRLSKRDFSIEDIISIETKLDTLELNLNDENRKKYFRKVLNSFKEYLKTEFSLVSKGYYTEIGMSLGMCFGVAFGAAIEKTIGTSSGLAIGMLIGLVIGRIMDTKAEKEGKVL
ncbi:MAG: hypothetical protein COA88_01715 [Kordia sp.]|nr:MAG: hypothetical protein COA88_01715 [Kordia sp.]